MKHVEACLKYQRRSRKQFSPRWRTCGVGAGLFNCGKYLITPFLPPRKCCEVRGCPIKCHIRSKKQFSPLWKHCEVGASLFMCGKDLTTPFSPPRKCCEVRGGLFMC